MSKKDNERPSAATVRRAGSESDPTNPATTTAEEIAGRADARSKTEKPGDYSARPEVTEKPERADVTAPVKIMPDVPPASFAPPMPADERPVSYEPLPPPNAIPDGNPDDPAVAPGVAPRGDARSLRRSKEFALIYRRVTAVITRFGTVGQRGQWRVVEYPTQGAAGNGYAKECARFLDAGFVDFLG